MAPGMVNQQFHWFKDLSKWIDSWVASNDEHLYFNDIEACPEPWEKLSPAMCNTLDGSVVAQFAKKMTFSEKTART